MKDELRQRFTDKLNASANVARLSAALALRKSILEAEVALLVAEKLGKDIQQSKRDELKKQLGATEESIIAILELYSSADQDSLLNNLNNL